jgi:hypothetical protein
MNYQWSRSPQLLADPINRLMAGLAASALLGSAVWYIKEGDRGTGGFLGSVGGLQIWAAMQKPEA